MVKFCTNCGKQLEDPDNFCIFCGAQVKEKPVDKNKKSSPNNSINNEKTFQHVEIYDGVMKYETFLSNLSVKYIIYKVKFGTTSDDIKRIIENGEYNYKIDIYYYGRGIQKLYFRSPKSPNKFFKFHNDRFNAEMKNDNKEIIHVSSYAKIHHPSSTKIFNFNKEKTFILANRYFEENIRKTRL